MSERVGNPGNLFPAGTAAGATSNIVDAANVDVKVFTVQGSAGFAGTVQVQGQHSGDGNTWQNAEVYVHTPPALGAAGPQAGALNVTSSYLNLYCLEPWEAMQVVLTVTSGTVQVDWYGSRFDAAAFQIVLAGQLSSFAATLTGSGDGQTVTQSDAAALQATAHLAVDGESVSLENPVPVTIPETISAALAAGEQHIGQAGGYGVTRVVDIVRPNNATAYTANDVINNSVSPLVIPNAVRKPGGAAWLQSITVLGDQAAGGGAETWQPAVWIYQRSRTVQLADNAPFTGSFQIMRQIGFLTLQVAPALAAPAGSTVDKSVVENIALLLQADTDSQDLYFDLQTLNAFTPAAYARYAVIFALTQI